MDYRTVKFPAPLTITDLWVLDEGEVVAEWHEGQPEPKPPVANGQTIMIWLRHDGVIEI